MGTFGRSFGLQWHLTDQCDQRCKHCYIWSKKEKVKLSKKKLNLEQCVSVVDKFFQFCESFKVDPIFGITGGDPFLFPAIWELLKYLHRKGAPFIILGNPFYITSDICEKLVNFGCRGYQMSLDGLEQTHDTIRKKGSFKDTFRALKILQSFKIRTTIMSTVSRFNFQEIPELIKIVVDYGVDAFDFARYCPVTKEDGIRLNLTPQEYRKFLSDIWKVYTRLANYSTKFGLKDHLWTLFLYEERLFRINDLDIVFQGCNCAIRHLAVLPDGTVYACRRFKSPVGNILTQSFQEIFLGKKLSQYREIKKLEGCRDCELLNYCRGCHAVSYGTFGSFFAKDPQCWKC